MISPFQMPQHIESKLVSESENYPDNIWSLGKIRYNQKCKVISEVGVMNNTGCGESQYEAGGAMLPKRPICRFGKNLSLQC